MRIEKLCLFRNITVSPTLIFNVLGVNTPFSYVTVRVTETGAAGGSILGVGSVIGFAGAAGTAGTAGAAGTAGIVVFIERPGIAGVAGVARVAGFAGTVLSFINGGSSGGLTGALF